MEHYLVRSSKIANSLYLSEIELQESSKEVVYNGTNHVFCCDISYSMYDVLPKMRNQLKNRIPDLVKEEDTITIIVFSGKGECTVLKELVSVKNVSDLQKLNEAIDRFMVPTGLTCFLDPVDLTNKLISDNTNNKPWSFIFLSDGGNNECPWSDVVSSLESLNCQELSNATIIEYGYFADSSKLSEMAETLGGSKVKADDFDSYEPIIEKTLNNESLGARVEFNISDFKSNLKYQQFVIIDNATEQIKVVSSANKNSINIPIGTRKLYCLTTKNIGNEELNRDDSYFASYALAYVCADKLRYEVVEQLLSFTGDSKLIEMYCNSYGKQKLFAFQNELLVSSFDKNNWGERIEDYKPNPKAYCLLDLIDDLQSGDNYVCIANPYFEYNRISAKSVVKKELSKDQLDALSKAHTKAQIDKVSEETSKSIPKMTMIDKPYSIKSLTWNEDRANLSFMVYAEVELELPENQFGLATVNSNVIRNYTIIKDGVVNIKELPVKLDDKTFRKIKSKNADVICSDIDQNGVVLLDLQCIPVINKSRVTKIDSKQTTELAYHLMHTKFELKYLGWLKKKKKYNPTVTSSSSSTKDSPSDQPIELTNYLASLGITKNGYQPKTEVVKSGDSYVALTFKSDFKKFSSIPKIEDVLAKRESGKKMTESETYMDWIINSYSEDDMSQINDHYEILSNRKKQLIDTLAQIKFALILSRKWFKDKEGFEDNKCSYTTTNGQQLEIEYKFTETTVNI